MEKAKKQDEVKSETDVAVTTPKVNIATLTNEKALAEALKPAPGTEEIGNEDITLPRLRLIQDNSAEVKAKEGVSGKLKHTLTSEFFDTVEFIPIAMHKTRIMFDTDNREGAPICRSNDTKIGSDGTECIKCDNSKWTAGKPPLCNNTFNYLVVRPEEVGNTIMPTILSFMKTSAQAALKLNTAVECTFPRQPFWTKVWKVIPRVKRFPKGDAWILDVQQVRDTTAEERQWAELIYKNTLGKKIDLTAEEIPTDEITGDLD